MTPAPAAPVRILSADEEAVFLSATAELLRLGGYKVETAPSGQEGAEARPSSRLPAETGGDRGSV